MRITCVLMYVLVHDMICRENCHILGLLLGTPTLSTFGQGCKVVRARTTNWLSVSWHPRKTKKVFSTEGRSHIPTIFNMHIQAYIQQASLCMYLLTQSTIDLPILGTYTPDRLLQSPLAIGLRICMPLTRLVFVLFPPIVLHTFQLSYRETDEECR